MFSNRGKRYLQSTRWIKPQWVKRMDAEVLKRIVVSSLSQFGKMGRYRFCSGEIDFFLEMLHNIPTTKRMTSTDSIAGWTEIFAIAIHAKDGNRNEGNEGVVVLGFGSDGASFEVFVHVGCPDYSSEIVGKSMILSLVTSYSTYIFSLFTYSTQVWKEPPATRQSP